MICKQILLITFLNETDLIYFYVFIYAFIYFCTQWNGFMYCYISHRGRCTWCNGYRRRKWTRWHEFKSWTWLIAFNIALIPLRKVWIQLFSLLQWVNSEKKYYIHSFIQLTNKRNSRNMQHIVRKDRCKLRSQIN